MEGLNKKSPDDSAMRSHAAVVTMSIVGGEGEEARESSVIKMLLPGSEAAPANKNVSLR